MSLANENKTEQVKYPITDRVLEAMEVSKRGCDELLVEAEWLAKLARSEATKTCLLYTSDAADE